MRYHFSHTTFSLLHDAVIAMYTQYTSLSRIFRFSPYDAAAIDAALRYRAFDATIRFVFYRFHR